MGKARHSAVCEDVKHIYVYITTAVILEILVAGRKQKVWYICSFRQQRQKDQWRIAA